ncbi:hypothetical protein KIH41_06655 [Litoribacter ruber]|uniref:Uncharacterized protein n=1 Tax=Litoribacter ruber TaxID=702568 RepID=A0AAP2G0B2_9BACT|nr:MULTISPECIES: hypothetical protein [Litoribacter]MBS9522439.1 hypothetical protein [Litoribacter alkaliphilus]MBT0810959.1 hypothetical protein [Litoribacter ruber]
MKLPSLFKSASHQRFDIKPRFYDPVKEEIEQRTSRIQKELESKGVLHPDEYGEEDFGKSRSSSLRGAFTQSSLRKSSSGGLSSAGLLRMLIFVILMVGVFGYIYYGNAALYALLYIAAGAGLVMVFFRLKGKKKHE